MEVYIHTLPDCKRYIGKAHNSQSRWKNGYSYNKEFQHEILRYGWENIEHEVFKDGLTEGEASELEHNLIIGYKTYDKRYGLNRTLGKDKNGKPYYDEESRKARVIMRSQRRLNCH